MGHMRMLVEQTVKDVMVLLQRNRVHGDLITEVRHHLNRILIQGCLREEAFTMETSKAAPPEDVCAGILLDIVDDVATKIVPQRQVVALEEERGALLRQQWVLQTEIKSLQSMVSTLNGQLRRGDAASELALESYFKEVFLLRQQIADLQNTVDWQQLQLLERERDSSSTAPPTITPTPSARPLFQYTTGSPSPSAQNRLTLQVPPSSRGAAVQGQTLGVLNLGGGGVDPSPLVASLDPNNNNATVAGGGGGKSPQDPPFSSMQRNTQPAALFDYQKYLDLQRSTGMNIIQKYEELKQEFEEYKKWSEEEQEKVGNFTAERIEAKNMVIEDLQQQVKDVKTNAEYFRNRAKAIIIDLRKQMEGIKLELSGYKETMSELKQQSDESLEQLAIHDDLLIKYVKAASNFLVVQLTSSTGEKVSRDAFQQALHLSEQDTDAEKRSKLYWRQHPITATILSSIVAVRQSTSSMKQSIKRAKILSEEQMKQASDLQLGGGMLSSPLTADGAPSSPLSKLSPAEVIRFSGNRAFLFSLFEKAKDPNFDMSETSRTAIFLAADKYKGLAEEKYKLVFSRIKRRALNTKIRRCFEATMLDQGLDKDSVMESVVHLKEVSLDQELKVSEQCHKISTEIDQLAHQLLSSLEKEFVLRVEINNPKKDLPKVEQAAGFKQKTGYVDAKTRIKRLGALSAPQQRRGTVLQNSGGGSGAPGSGGAGEGNDLTRSGGAEDPTLGGESPRVMGAPGSAGSMRLNTSMMRSSAGLSAGGVGGASIASPVPLGTAHSSTGALATLPMGADMSRGIVVVDHVAHMDNDTGSDLGEDGGMRIRTLMPTGQMLYIPSMGGIGTSSTNKQSLMTLANGQGTPGSARAKPRPKTGTNHPKKPLGVLPPQPPPLPGTRVPPPQTPPPADPNKPMTPALNSEPPLLAPPPAAEEAGKPSLGDDIDEPTRASIPLPPKQLSSRGSGGGRASAPSTRRLSSLSSGIGGGGGSAPASAGVRRRSSAALTGTGSK